MIRLSRSKALGLALVWLAGAAAQNAVFPANPCHTGTQTTYNQVEKSCDDGTGGETGGADWLNQNGGLGRSPLDRDGPGYIEELSCACGERACKCHRKCDCKIPSLKPDATGNDQLACVCDRMLCNCQRSCDCTQQPAQEAAT